MTAFTQAWTFLKADPESLGAHRVALPLPIMGMMNRLREQGKLGQRGDVRGETGTVMNPYSIPAVQQAMQENPDMTPAELEALMQTMGAIEGGVRHTGEYPIEVGEGEGDRIPIDPAEIERDMSPLRENVASREGQSTRLIGDKLDNRHGYRDKPMYRTMPEESFYSPQEQYAIDPEFARIAGRNILGQKGTFQNITGGGSSGINQLDFDTKGRGIARKPTVLGRTEGLQSRGKLNQRSSTDTKARNEAMKELQLRQLVRDNPNMSAGQILEARKKMDEEAFTPDYEGLQDEFAQMGADFELPPPPAPPQQIFNPTEQMRAEQLSPLGARAQALIEESKGLSGEEFRRQTQSPETGFKVPNYPISMAGDSSPSPIQSPPSPKPFYSEPTGGFVDPRLYEMMQMRSGDDMKQRLQELGMDDMSTSKRIGEAAREKMQAMRDEDMRRRIAQLQREQARPSQTQSDIDEQG